HSSTPLLPYLFMNWTDSQLEAVETRGRRMIVSAGAGSGKTRVLVERFLRLLEENSDWRVSDIVAVTFTEKAAREMVSRIRREIRSRIEKSRSSEERRRWREHRNALDSARIGTIHSLCSSILRSHPAEAGLDPAFEVMDELEAAALMDQAIERAIADAARDANADAGIEVFSHLSSREVSSILRSLIYQGERAARAVSRIGGLSADDIAKFQREQFDQARKDTALLIVERDTWKRNAQIVASLRANDPTDKMELVRSEVAALLAGLDEERTIETLLAIERSIDLRGGSKKKWPSEEALGAIRESLRDLREAVKGEPLLKLEMNEADEASAEVIAGLARLYAGAREQFASLKRQRALLDFNDLEELTERLLTSHEEVCCRYNDPHRGLIRALMIDEFQDTSPIQKRILWAIAPRSGELFIIGDAKQSIYRFRGADVTIFHDAREEFNSAGGREVGMDYCFRTHDRLVDFINHLFPSIFTTESRHDTPYQAMKAARAAAHSNPAVEIHFITQKKDEEESLKTADLRQAEARLIARRIKEIISGDEIVHGEDGRLRRAEPGDFALLFQASTYFEIYEQALADAGLPYVTTAGRGFYDRQEIVDLSNLLGFLASPIDNLRLAAALRSPLFALSDETLLRLRRRHGLLWDALGDESTAMTDDERERVEFARKVLTRLRERAGRMSAADLITAALEETGYLATLMMLPGGERRVANVEKFIEQARALPRLTLLEMVERIEDLKFREAREGEATVEESGAVRIMTVHKAKGLEFPVVWIVDASYGGGRDRDLATAHQEFGLAVAVKVDGAEADDLQPAFFKMVKLVEARAEQSEKKRLLYVAATRARDLMIVSGALRYLRGDDWLARLAVALGIDEEGRAEVIEYPGGEVAVSWHDARMISETALAADQSSREASADASPKTSSPDASELFPLIRPITPA
ncbi:MAG: UvrD-helicase domain-containing protein, partial [Acidobacteriota bacterium]